MLLHGPLAEVAGIMEILFWFFVLHFSPPRTGNISANKGSSREEDFEWPFPAGAWARQKQLLNMCSDVPSLSRPSGFFY